MKSYGYNSVVMEIHHRKHYDMDSELVHCGGRVVLQERVLKYPEWSKKDSGLDVNSANLFKEHTFLFIPSTFPPKPISQ
jgi:hypothetical protein